MKYIRERSKNWLDDFREHPKRASWLAHDKRHADGASPRGAYIDAKAAGYEAIVAETISWVSNREKTRV